jgi:Mitochondrial carrier protein
MQTDDFANPKFRNTADLIKWAKVNQGQLYKGLGPCAIRAAPANGVTFFLYENVMKILNPVSK